MGSGDALLERIKEYILNPGVRVLFALGLFLFFWGIIEFLWAVKDGSPTEEGKKHMVWGLVGMLIMVSVYGIIALVVNTLGLGDSATDVTRIQNVNVNPGGTFFK